VHADIPYLDLINSGLSISLYLVGLYCLLSRRNVIKQIVGLRIMVQGAVLSLIHAGYLLADLSRAQSMVTSALIVEAIVIAVALALIVNIFRHEPTGDIDKLNRLRG
jgi:NADH:ubiquinone oxidoreductase subunit K